MTVSAICCVIDTQTNERHGPFTRQEATKFVHSDKAPRNTTLKIISSPIESGFQRFISRGNNPETAFIRYQPSV